MSQYKRLVRDRPHKFSTTEVGFTQTAPDRDQRCSCCFHWFSSLVQRRGTCEIYKGKGEERRVPSGGSCMFWTKNGISFPRMEATEHKTSTPPKGEDNASTDAYQEGDNS